MIVTYRNGASRSEALSTSAFRSPSRPSASGSRPALIHAQPHSTGNAAIRAAGRATGEVLAAAVTMLDPGLIVVGGDMAPAHELFVAGLRDTLFRDATVTAGDDLRGGGRHPRRGPGRAGTAAVALSRVLHARRGRRAGVAARGRLTCAASCADLALYYRLTGGRPV
jgi:predicted NBD/HSP70 family sugar kinase